MASNNRATQINKVLKAVKKHFKPADPLPNCTVLEHTLLACCLENSNYEDASRVLATLTKDYFDWNEVRVSSIRELTEVLKPLNDPEESATRLKRVLQSVFETQYSFDLEPMLKRNIGQAAKQLEKLNGASAFTVAYVTQNALGGHAIPVNEGLLQAMYAVGVISESEAAKKTIPGLERAIPKTKGVEVGSLLHQLGVELHRSPYGPTIRKLLLEIEPKCKDRLPKRPGKKVEVPQPEPIKAEPKPKKKKTSDQVAVAKKTAAQKTKPAKKKATVKKAASKKAAGKSRPKKTPVKKKKKVAKKKTTSASKGKKKTSSKRLTRKKPR